MRPSLVVRNSWRRVFRRMSAFCICVRTRVHLFRMLATACREPSSNKSSPAPNATVTNARLEHGRASRLGKKTPICRSWKVRLTAARRRALGSRPLVSASKLLLITVTRLTFLLLRGRLMRRTTLPSWNSKRHWLRAGVHCFLFLQPVHLFSVRVSSLVGTTASRPRVQWLLLSL